MLHFICGTGVLSLLFDYRVGQGVPLPALYRLRSSCCLGASDWSTLTSCSHSICARPRQREWVHSQMLFHSTNFWVCSQMYGGVFMNVYL